MLKIALAQLNFLVGDMAGNTEKIIAAVYKAQAQSARMVIFSELALTGYPPEDLLLRAETLEKVARSLKKIREACPDCYVIVGHPEQIKNQLLNAVSVFYQGNSIATYYKQYLPNYGVFDEKRYFQEGRTPACVFDFEGVKTGLIICEDLWHAKPMRQLTEQGAQWAIVINASPYEVAKDEMRKTLVKKRIKKNGLPIVYVNQVGGQDDLIFDGNSFAMNVDHQLCVQAKQSEEALVLVELSVAKSVAFLPGKIAENLTDEARNYKALVLAVKDYVSKNGFERVFVGLSGGIDSALTLAIAVDALGADAVTAIVMPSPYTLPISLEDADALAKALHVKTEIIAIAPMMTSFESALAPLFHGVTLDITGKNIQARIRGMLLMAFANQFNGLVLTTSNKSEVAVGYSTLYGDMAGAFDVLKDVYKTEVYRLAAYRNDIKKVIPPRTITRAPSAELAPNQTDQDDLPPYAVLDAILNLYIEENEMPEKIIQKGFDASLVNKIIKLVNQSEYKRQQAPQGPRVSARGFGKDWRFPITKK